YRDEIVLLPFLPNAELCFSNISELHCSSRMPCSIFYRMAQICRNLEKLVIDELRCDNDGLATLISVQQNLKAVGVFTHANSNVYLKVANAISSKANTLKYFSYGGGNAASIPFANIAALVNLESLSVKLYDDVNDIFLYTTFPNLKILEIQGLMRSMDVLTKFVERCTRIHSIIKMDGGISRNGFQSGILEKICFDLAYIRKPFCNVPEYNATIARCCPNLRFFSTWFHKLNAKEFKEVIRSCKKLEHLTVSSYRYEKSRYDDSYDPYVNELIECLGELEDELEENKEIGGEKLDKSVSNSTDLASSTLHRKHKVSMNLSTIEFCYIWKLDSLREFENYLRRRKSRGRPMNIYFNNECVSLFGIDLEDYLLVKFRKYKEEGLVNQYGIKNYKKFYRNYDVIRGESH
ncbi:9318_t:CDS:1, partial [Acaulospora morrowiae]